MSSREDIELLRAIWTCFDSPSLIIDGHPILSEAVPADCLGRTSPPDLTKVVDSIAAKGNPQRALDITLKKLHEEWYSLSAETKSKVLQLSDSHPRRIKGFPSLSPNRRQEHAEFKKNIVSHHLRNIATLYHLIVRRCDENAEMTTMDVLFQPFQYVLPREEFAVPKRCFSIFC
jgi:hypothetical protein